MPSKLFSVRTPFLSSLAPSSPHREEVPELVEGGGHHAVGRVESLLHAVAVVHVNVDVQHALVVPAAGSGWDEKNNYSIYNVGQYIRG